MSNLLAHETFLRFETLKSTSQIMRARAVYITGLAFIVTQLVNIFFMTISYGEWTADHGISLAGCIGVAIVMFTLRYTKNFHYFSVIYSLMLLAGVGMSASVDATGINTALLPLIIVGALLNGFIGGWRHIILYGFISLAFIWKLYDVALVALPMDAIDDPTGKTRLFQRAMQSSLALFMVSVCTCLIAYTMNRLFSELDNTLEKLSRSNQQKIDFLAHVNHELSRPLAGVNDGLKKLAERRGDTDAKQNMQLTQRYLRRLNLFIRDMSILTRLDKGKLKLETAPFNLRHEIKSTLQVYEAISVKKAVHLGMTYAAHLPETFMGDVRLIRQVLKNLTLNALKHTSSGSVHVYVDGRLKGADEVQLRLRVKDTGPGITDEDMDSIFDRFVPGTRNKETRKYIGTGLELAISHELIKFMGGALEVESELQKGTNFEITLTLKVTEAVDLPHDTMKSAPFTEVISPIKAA